ncbi:MAG: DUF2723 domain-containing protein [Phycisphaerales bacterium]|nr:DUF2723 domain-containing protein [Phycisphaerales bacterium]
MNVVAPASPPLLTSSALVGISCGFVAFALYLITLAPGVCWQDSGVHQFRIVNGMLENPYGLALSHPLHYWLGRGVLSLPPGGVDPAWKLNLLSAVSGALGVGVIAALVAAITRRGTAAVLAAAALAIAHTYWAHSVVTESYALAAALMSVEWLLLWRYSRRGEPGALLAVFMLNGLHVSNHLLGLLPLASYGVLGLERVARRRLHAGWLGVFALGWVVTASPYLSLIVRQGMQSHDWGRTLHSALFGVGLGGGGYANDVLNTSISWGLAKNAVLVLGYNFPSLVIPLGLAGMGRPARQRGVLFRNVMLGQTLLIAVFVLRYSIRDQYTFFVPLCAVLALWFGIGVDGLLRYFEQAGARPRDPSGLVRVQSGSAGPVILVVLTLATIAPLGVYAIFPSMAAQRGWLRSQMRDLPFRDEYRHFLQPWRIGDDSPRQYARAVLAECPPRGLLMTDLTAGYAIAYVQRVENFAPDVEVYVVDRNLTRANMPLMTADALRRAAQRGAAIRATPSPVIEEWWGSDFDMRGEGLVRDLLLRTR